MNVILCLTWLDVVNSDLVGSLLGALISGVFAVQVWKSQIKKDDQEKISKKETTITLVNELRSKIFEFEAYLKEVIEKKNSSVTVILMLTLEDIINNQELTNYIDPSDFKDNSEFLIKVHTFIIKHKELVALLEKYNNGKDYDYLLLKFLDDKNAIFRLIKDIKRIKL